MTDTPLPQASAAELLNEALHLEKYGQSYHAAAALRFCAAQKERLEAQSAPASGVEAFTPTDTQINSACMSYRHDFGLLPDAERKAVRFEAREWLHAWQKEGATPAPVPSPSQAVAWRYRYVTTLDGKSWSDWFIVDQRESIPNRRKHEQVIEPLYAAPAAPSQDVRLALDVRTMLSDLVEALTHEAFKSDNAHLRDCIRDARRLLAQTTDSGAGS